MRLISQNGMIDVPYEKVILGICDQNNRQEYVIYAYHDSPRPLFLATYSNTDKALKVMEMLREKYAKLEIFKSVYQKGLLTELNKELGFDEMQNTLTSIFQFPKDKEVEVQDE